MTLAVTVQLASSRRGVPHVRSLRRWADAAFSQRPLRPVANASALTIRVVGAAESRRLNRMWRGKDKPTNVLSFPAEPLPVMARGAATAGRAPLPLELAQVPYQELPELGDLAICAPVVAREARQQDKSSQAHWAHMVVHGVLHLLGYDHENENDAAVMETREAKILEQFGYTNPYA